MIVHLLIIYEHEKSILSMLASSKVRAFFPQKSLSSPATIHLEHDILSKSTARPMLSTFFFLEATLAIGRH